MTGNRKLKQPFDARTNVKENIQEDEDTGCHIWTGSVNLEGRAVMQVAGRREYVTRVVLALQDPEFLMPELALTCPHSLRCVNPDHLGTSSRSEVMSSQNRKLEHHEVTQIVALYRVGWPAARIAEHIGRKVKPEQITRIARKHLGH